MRKKIAFISEHASPLATLGGVDSGGQNVYVDKLSKQLVNLDYDVDIFTRWDDERLPEIVEYSSGVRIIHIKAGPLKFIKKENLFSHMKEFSENIINFIKKQSVPYKIIHANFWMSGLSAMEIKIKLDIPFVITFHALGKIRRIYQGKNDKFPNKRFEIEEKIIKNANQIIAECPQEREDLILYYKASQDKISIIPCGFDPNEFYPVDKNLAKMLLGVNTNDPIILQLGRMVPRKGIDNVIKSISELKHKHGFRVNLFIVGGDSDTPDPDVTPEIARLQKIAEKEKVLEDITFFGRKGRDRLKYFYSVADVFVTTPWYEPFGITPLEAMACGTPVIGSNVGGIKFSIVDERTGFLVPPNNWHALSEKIMEIIQNPKLANQFKENGIKRVNSFFMWSTVARSISSIYEEIIFSNQTAFSDFEQQSQIIENNFNSLIKTTYQSAQSLKIPILDVGRILSKCLINGKKILVCGNGGSAADSSHFAAELIGRFQMPTRKALPIISLNTDISVLTAWANDFSYDTVFSRQTEALGKKGDVFLGISTSGNSKNIIEAMKAAKKKKMVCVGLVGKDGGEMVRYCDTAIVVPSFDVQRIQETHSLVIHTMCELIEKQLFLGKTSRTIKEQAMEEIKNNFLPNLERGRNYGRAKK